MTNLIALIAFYFQPLVLLKLPVLTALIVKGFDWLEAKWKQFKADIKKL